MMLRTITLISLVAILAGRRTDLQAYSVCQDWVVDLGATGTTNPTPQLTLRCG
jgi:hypothetical protein